MEPVPFKEQNATLGAPENAPDVLDLPVHRSDEYVISCWQLTTADIERITETGKIWLTVRSLGGSQPPVLITTESPFE